MKKILNNIKPESAPILFTMVWLFTALVVSEIFAGILGNRAYSMLICALLTVVIAFAFKKSKQLHLTSKPNLAALKFYIMPVIFILSIPLLTGGYKFSFITTDVVLMMAGVGIFEEVLTHSICMGLLIQKWGKDRKSILKAGIVSSLAFGLFHLLAILQDPTNEYLILMKLSTVVFATFIGIGFAGLVHVTNSIWPAAILHAAIDIMFYVGSADILNKIYNEWTLQFTLVSILYTLPLALYGIWLLRKRREEITFSGTERRLKKAISPLYN